MKLYLVAYSHYNGIGRQINTVLAKTPDEYNAADDALSDFSELRKYVRECQDPYRAMSMGQDILRAEHQIIAVSYLGKLGDSHG